MMMIIDQLVNQIIDLITDYLGVDESDTVSLHALMLGNRRRKFDILITQIPCHSEISGKKMI